MASRDTIFDRFPHVAALFNRPTLKEWRATAKASLKGRPLDTLSHTTLEGLRIDPLYTAADSSGDPGFPGFAPYVRGRTALAAGPSGWSACQRVSHPDPAAAAGLVREELARGITTLWLRFDRSCGITGALSDTGGHDGIELGTAADLGPLVRQLEPGRHLVHIDAGAGTPAVAAAFAATARKADLNLHELGGSFNVDPLGALAADGELPAGIGGSFAAMAELARWSRLHAPDFRTITVDTTSHQLAGAHAVQELAIALATAIAYVRALAELGIEPAETCRQVLFRFAIGRDLFLETAKLRAFRRLWSRAAEACGVPAEDWAAPVHTVTSLRSLTTRDPWVNMLRTTVASFAAAAGGADIITVLPFDSAIGQPDELGRRIAANSQTILKEESHLARVADPGGGSWYMEHLTDELAREAWSRFQAIEGAGGIVELLLRGDLAAELGATRRAHHRALATRREPITGVSTYPNLAEDSVRRPTPGAGTLSETAEATEELARLADATAGTSGDGALMDAAVEAATAGASLRAIAQAMAAGRDPLTVPPLPAIRDAAPFEALRTASDLHLEATGGRPRVFLANMGPVAEHKPRAAFATHFFEAGGIEALGNSGFDTVDRAVAAFADSGAPMAVICSSDDRYPDLVPKLAAGLESAGARTVLVAGRPGEHEETWRAAGVTGFIFAGCDVHRILVDLLEEEGVLHV